MIEVESSILPIEVELDPISMITTNRIKALPQYQSMRTLRENGTRTNCSVVTVTRIRTGSTESNQHGSVEQNREKDSTVYQSYLRRRNSNAGAQRTKENLVSHM